jgi:hypothetical protein
MSNPRSGRPSSSSITSEHFRDTRARAWAFVFHCYRKKVATRPGGPNDGTKSSKGDSAYEHIL